MKDFIIITIFIILIILYISWGHHLQRKELFTPVVCSATGSIWRTKTAPDGTVISNPDHTQCISEKVSVSFTPNGRVLTCSAQGQALVDNGQNTTNAKWCKSNRAAPIKLNDARPTAWDTAPVAEKIAELIANTTPYFTCQALNTANIQAQGIGQPVGAETDAAFKCQTFRAQVYNNKKYCDPYGMIFAGGVANDGTKVSNITSCKSGKGYKLPNSDFFMCGDAPEGSQFPTVNVPNGNPADSVDKCLSGRGNPQT